MKLRMLRCYGLAISILLLAGCASQSTTTPASTPSGASTSITPVAGKTCDLDYKKMCQQFIDRPQITYNGQTIQTNRLEESLGRHPQILMPATNDAGEVVATIECRYSADQGTNKVVSAGLQSGATLDAKAIRYAQSKGLCGSGVDYQKEITHQEDRQLGQ